MVIGGGYIGMEVAAATTGWNLDTTVIINYFPSHFRSKMKDILFILGPFDYKD